MGIVSRIGQWLDTRFPEKISADTVLAHLASMNGTLEQFRSAGQSNENRILALETQVRDLEKKAAEQISEMNKAKMAFMSLRPQPSTFPHR